MDFNEMLHVIKNGIELDIDNKGYLAVQNENGFWEKTKFKLEQSLETGQVDAVVSVLPSDEEVEEWLDTNVDGDSASSAIYKFRLWLEERQKAHLT